VAIMIKFVRKLKDRGSTKFQLSPLQKLVGRIVAIVFMGCLVWLLYTQNQNEIRQRQEIAARPHTVRILGYQITFPKELPPGCDGGTIDVDYANDWEDGKEGKEGRTRFARWWIYNGGEPNESGIEFMVNELAQPGCLPSGWQHPPDWEKIVWTRTGTKEIAGLKFIVSHWQGKAYDSSDILDAQQKSAKQTGSGENYRQFLPAHGKLISGVDYLAQHKNKLIGLRGYGCGEKKAAIALTESVLNTFQKFKYQTPKGKNSTGITADGSVVMGHAGDSDKFIDPAVQLIK